VTREQIIQEVLDGDYDQVCRQITSNKKIHEDLYQEMIMVLLEYKEGRLEEIIENSGVRRFVVGLLCRMFQSRTSPFYKKFIKYNDLKSHYNVTKNEGEDDPTLNDKYDATIEEGYDHTIDDKLIQVEYELSKMEWYDAELLLIYLEEGSCRKVQKATQIPYKSVNDVVRSTVKEIQTNIGLN